MLKLIGDVTINSVYSKDYNFDRNGKNFKGISYKGRLVLPDSSFNPNVSLSKEVFDKLNDNNGQVGKTMNVTFDVSFGFDNGSVKPTLTIVKLNVESPKH